jgi:hypothetical protein
MQRCFGTHLHSAPSELTGLHALSRMCLIGEQSNTQSHTDIYSF